MIFSISDHWREELRLILAIALVASLAGWLTEQLLLCLLLGLLVYIGWHLYQLACLPHLLKQDHCRTPHPTGLWKNIVTDIQELHARNLSERRDLSDQLDRFRDTVNALPDGVVILDTSKQVEWSNPAAGDLLGVTWPDSKNRLLTTLAPDPVLDEYLAGNQFTLPQVITSPANPAIILSIFITPLTEENRRLMLVASDITRQYYLDKARRDFLANISHELRTPLTVIYGLAELLNMDEPEQGRQKHPTGLILKQAARINDLVSDLLTLSRLETQQEPAPEEHVPVSELLSTIIEEAHTLSGPARHELKLDIRSPEGLLGNRKELHTAFSNLVTNAVRHTPNQAEISVLWRVDSAGAHLSVVDTGEGIAARHIPRLTERLYRVDASHSRDTGGTGLGLAIVKHILEHHEAELEITSTVGGGSNFTCHFPPERISCPTGE